MDATDRDKRCQIIVFEIVEIGQDGQVKDEKEGQERPKEQQHNQGVRNRTENAPNATVDAERVTEGEDITIIPVREENRNKNATKKKVLRTE